MLPIIDSMSLDKSELKHKLKEEVARYALFQTGVLGINLNQSKKHKDINIKNICKAYATTRDALTETRSVVVHQK